MGRVRAPLRDAKVPGVAFEWRGDSVRMVVSHGFDPVTGQRRKFNRTVRPGSKTELERAASKFLEDVRRGEVAQPGQGTLRDYLEGNWLPSITKMASGGRPLAPTTAETYRYELARVTKHIGDVPLARLTARHVEQLRDALMASRMSGGTISETLNHLSRALERARKRGIIPTNPADPELVTRPADDEEDDQGRAPITPNMARAILEAAQGTRFEVPAALGLHSMRREEVLGLRWQDVVLDGEEPGLRVRQTVTRTNGDVHLGPPKSRKSRRSIPLLGFAVDALLRQREEQAERRKLCGDGWTDPDPDLVMDRGDGRPINPSTFSTAWGDWMRGRGFGDVGGFHQLRRGCATLLRSLEVDPLITSEILGHTDPRFTEAVYTDVYAEQKREAMAKLAGALGRAR